MDIDHADCSFVEAALEALAERPKLLYVEFARMFPLSQTDLPAHESSRVHAAFVGRAPPPPELALEKPSRDYTPPCYITMLFTDLGVLTPSAVSDELIKLFD